MSSGPWYTLRTSLFSGHHVAQHALHTNVSEVRRLEGQSQVPEQTPLPQVLSSPFHVFLRKHMMKKAEFQGGRSSKGTRKNAIQCPEHSWRLHMRNNYLFVSALG